MIFLNSLAHSLYPLPVLVVPDSSLPQPSVHFPLDVQLLLFDMHFVMPVFLMPVTKGTSQNQHLGISRSRIHSIAETLFADGLAELRLLTSFL